MKYTAGGVSGSIGQALTVEVPVAGKPPAKSDGGGAGLAKDEPAKPAESKLEGDRVRFTAWTRSYELFYADPKKGGLPDFDRCRKILDNCAGKLDDLIILSTFNIQIPKPADGTPTGKAVWDSDFIYADKDAPDVAKKLVDECHSRNIAVHAGYAIVDAGKTPGNRSKAFCKFMETASDDQIKDHASQLVALMKQVGFDGLSFDLEINNLSVQKHADGVRKLFQALSSQMEGILSYAPYPFQTDGKAPGAMAFCNAVPYSLTKLGKNIIARPQAYRNHETMDQLKTRVAGTIKCALEDVGLPPEQFQIGMDYTGDSTFDAVRGNDMTTVASWCKDKKIGLVLWRIENPGSPSADNYDAWNKALNDGKPSNPGKLATASGVAPSDSPASTPSSKSSDQKSSPPQKAGETKPAGPQPDAPDAWFGVDYGSVDSNKPDFPKAKSDGKLHFAIVRGAYGTWGDPHFTRDFPKMKDHGVVRGTYLFLRFPKGGVKPESPEKQTKAFLKFVGSMEKTDFPPTIDVEFPGNGRKAETGMSAAECLDGVRQSWKTIKDELGVAPMIYTSARVWKEDLDNLAAPDLIESPLWLTPYVVKEHMPPILDPEKFKGGKYDPKVPPPWGDADNWWIHQYQGDSRGMPGFLQVDMNRFHALVKGATGERVKWVQRRLKIDESGTFDDAMVDKVKGHQSDNGLDATGTIDPKTFATLCWVKI